MNSTRVGRRPSTRSLATAALVATGALVMAGCQSAVDAESSSGGDGGVQEGGTLTIVQSADIQPASIFAQNNPNFTLMRTVFNSLTEYDRETLEPKPQLATSWEFNEDNTAITLELREGVTFHSGREFTAADVIFSLEAMTRDDVSSQLKHVALAITDMAADGDHALTITFAQPVSNLFDLFEIMPVVDSETFEDLLTGKQFVGTGPFSVAEYTPGSGLSLEKNDDYWVEGRPYLDGVEVSVQSQSSSMLSSLRSGQSQLALDLAPLDTVGIKDDPNFEVVVADAYDSTFYVASNVKVAPLDKPEVRQAIAWSVDRERILEQVLAGIGQPSSLPWSPSSPAYDEAKAQTYSRDLDKAKELLAEAGAEGEAVSIVFNSGLPTNQAIAEIVQFDLNEAGLKAKLVPLQAADFQAKLTEGTLPGLFVNGHGFGQLNPATLVKGAFPFNADANASNFDSDEYRSLATSLWATTDADESAEVYGKVNDFLIEQQFVNDLVTSSHTFTISKDLQGLDYNMFDYIDLDDAYLAD